MTPEKVAEKKKEKDQVRFKCDLLRNDRPRYRIYSICGGQLLEKREELDQTCVLEIFE